MNASDVISIICSIAGFIVALISLYVSIKIFKSQRKFENSLNERDEKRYNSQVEADANKFIQKYNANNEIQLLSLCVIAKKYDSTFPYRRQIYKDYCCLNDDIQREVLRKMNIDLRLMDLEDDNFFEQCLKLLEKDLKDYYPSYKSFYNDYFYDNAKYYYHSIKNYKNEKVPKLKVVYSNGILANFLDFKDIVTDVLTKVEYKDYLKEIKGFDEEDKINFLFNLNTELGSANDGKEIVMCYLECLIAKCVPAFLSKSTSFLENMGYYNDYFASCYDYYMEDLFLESLLSINIYNYTQGGD